MKCNCSVYLTFLLRYSCFLVILTLFFKLLEKYLKIIHKTCWHTYTRPPIGVTPSECLISCKMCSDKISLKLGMNITVRKRLRIRKMDKTTWVIKCKCITMQSSCRHECSECNGNIMYVVRFIQEKKKRSVVLPFPLNGIRLHSCMCFLASRLFLLSRPEPPCY